MNLENFVESLNAMKATDLMKLASAEGLKWRYKVDGKEVKMKKSELIELLDNHFNCKASKVEAPVPELTLIRQQLGDNTCGQCSVAMVAGITKEEAFEIYGHRKATNAKQHKEALTKLGFNFTYTPKVDGRKKLEINSDLALIRIEKVGRKMGHLVAYYKGKVYDPAQGKFDSIESLLENYNICNPRWRVHSYFEIEKQADVTKVAGA